MFRKYYKMAVDDIQPNRELIDKIFNKAEKEKKPISAVVYRYGMAVAAVLVLAVSVYSYPKITDYVYVNNNEIVQADIKAQGKTTDDEAENKNVDAASQPEEKSRMANISMDVEKRKEADSTGSVLNATLSEKTAEAEDALAMRAYTEDLNTETVVWDGAKYKEYLGFDIENNIKLPADFKNTTGNVFYIVLKDSAIENDLATFSFAADEKVIFVETSKLIKMSDVKEAVKLSDDEYETYFENNGIYFRVYSKGIDETQLKEVVNSLTN